MRLHISANDGVPIYLQIVQQVKYLVAAGRLAPGEELTPIRVWPSSCSSIRIPWPAYRELETAGIVTERRTAGTYVSDAGSPWPGANA